MAAWGSSERKPRAPVVSDSASVCVSMLVGCVSLGGGQGVPACAYRSWLEWGLG